MALVRAISLSFFVFNVRVYDHHILNIVLLKIFRRSTDIQRIDIVKKASKNVCEATLYTVCVIQSKQYICARMSTSRAQRGRFHWMHCRRRSSFAFSIDRTGRIQRVGAAACVAISHRVWTVYIESSQTTNATLPDSGAFSRSTTGRAENDRLMSLQSSQTTSFSKLSPGTDGPSWSFRLTKALVMIYNVTAR